MSAVLLGILITVLQCFDGVLFYEIFLRRRFAGLRFWGVFAMLAVCFGYLLNQWHLPVGMGKWIFGTTLFAVLCLVLYTGGAVFRVLVACLLYALLNGLDVIVVFLLVRVLNISLRISGTPPPCTLWRRWESSCSA